MSKRKNRKSGAPNLPQETLNRARQDAGLATPEGAERAEERDVPEPVEEVLHTPVVVSLPEVSQRRSEMPAATSKRKPRRKQLNYEDMTPEDVAYALEHPTMIVSEGELRSQYSYVLADLRSMAILAAVLFIALIVIAQIVIA